MSTQFHNAELMTPDRPALSCKLHEWESRMRVAIFNRCNRWRFTGQKLADMPDQARPKAIKRSNAGFTVVELLIVVAIVAVLLAIAFPSYKSIMGSNNVIAEINGLLGDLQFARSEAIKRGQSVRVCAANTAGTACNATGSSCNSNIVDWSCGWIVFFCNGSDCSAGVTSTNKLRVQATPKSGDTIVSGSATAISMVTFNYFGFRNAQTASITARPQGGATTYNRPKTLCLTSLGSLQVVTGDNSVCP